MSGAIGTQAIGASSIGSPYRMGNQPQSVFIASGAIGTYVVGGAPIGGSINYSGASISPPSAEVNDWVVMMRRRVRR